MHVARIDLAAPEEHLFGFGGAACPGIEIAEGGDGVHVARIDLAAPEEHLFGFGGAACPGIEGRKARPRKIAR